MAKTIDIFLKDKKSKEKFLEAFRYFSNLLGRGREKIAKEFAEQATGVKAPEKLEPVIPGNEPVVVRIPSKVERGELTTINSQLSDPMKSDFINSSMDGTAANRYAVLKTELNKMSPNLTQDLQYALDNNLGLTQTQKNNIVKNAQLERTLKSEIKKLENGLIAEKKDPEMIFEAYTSASKTLEGKEMFKGFEPKVIEGGKGITPKDRMTKTMIDEGYADPEYLDPNALDMYGKPITMDKAFFDKTREQIMKQINEQNRLMVPRSHGAYRDLQSSLRVSEDRLTALNITEEVGGNIKMFDKLRMKNGVKLDAIPLDKFKYIKGTPADESKKGIDYLFDKDGVLDKDAVLRDITEISNLKNQTSAYWDSIKEANKKFAKTREGKLEQARKTREGKLEQARKAGQGKFTKAEVLIARLENTLKTSKDPYVQKKFPGFIEEIKAKPELANNKNVFDTLSGPLPKGQRLVEYDDGTMDFFQKTDFGPQNIPPTQKLAQELGISINEASAILKMEPEDQVLEIGRRKALSDRIDNLVDDTLSEEPTSLYDDNFKDYFDPDDKPNQAKGGIISLT
jgi:hypothetical protein